MKKPELLSPEEILLAKNVLKSRRLEKKKRLKQNILSAMDRHIHLMTLARIEHIPSATLRKFIKKSIEQGAQ